MSSDHFKVLHLSYSISHGGAAMGALRLFRAMKKYGVDCEIIVRDPASADAGEGVTYLPLDIEPYRDRYARYNQRLRTTNPILKSYNLCPTGLASVINQSSASVVQCHWLGANTVSIPELAQVRKPLFWKLPDMWAISGAEHYDIDGDLPRYKLGYSRATRPPYEGGWDVNKWVWLLKKKHWMQPDFDVHFICPSRWLKGCVEESVLFRDRPVTHILNPLDTDLFRSYPKVESLEEFGLAHLSDKTVILFGSDASRDPRKGYDSLLQAIQKFRRASPRSDIACIVMGGNEDAHYTIDGTEYYEIQKTREVGRLVKLYNCGDVFVLPTSRDNLPNMIKEASCVGLPCVGFNVGGMPDMIDHLKTGYLAEPFSVSDLSAGIAWGVNNTSTKLRQLIREAATEKHSEKRAVLSYLRFYRAHLKTPNQTLDTHINTLSQNV